jgi:hypothetical protein
MAFTSLRFGSGKEVVMKWRAARNVDKNDKIIMLADAIDSDKGYRIIRQQVGLNVYKYSAWQPAPELQYPHLKLLDITDASDKAKAICCENYKKANKNE